MRIISGYLSGRIFDSPGKTTTHPMSEKMRGALFNALGDIEGLTLLDAFSGSGAISFEAISRGASSSLAIDNDKTAQRTILKNIKALDLANKVHLISTSLSNWSENNQDKQFDLVICDPPYDRLQNKVVQELEIHIKPGGLLVLSCPEGEGSFGLEGLEKISDKSYGDSSLVFYRKNK